MVALLQLQMLLPLLPLLHLRLRQTAMALMLQTTRHSQSSMPKQLVWKGTDKPLLSLACATMNYQVLHTS